MHIKKNCTMRTNIYFNCQRAGKSEKYTSKFFDILNHAQKLNCRKGVMFFVKHYGSQ